MPKRTPAQKMAVATVRETARLMVEEIDRHHDPRQTDFITYFHLDTWRTEKRTTNKGTPYILQTGGKVFQSVSRRISSGSPK